MIKNEILNDYVIIIEGVVYVMSVDPIMNDYCYDLMSTVGLVWIQQDSARRPTREQLLDMRVVGDRLTHPTDSRVYMCKCEKGGVK